MIDLAKAYEETQRNLAALVRELPEDELSTTVPASPDWTVKDVVAHVTGIAADVSGGTLPEELDILRAMSDPEHAAIRDAVTARQVGDRRDRSLEEILEEWDGALDPLLEMIRGERPFPRPVPFADAVVVTDLAVHAQDVRNAVRRPGDRDSAGVSVSLTGYAATLGMKLGAAGLPALRLRYDGKERVVGQGEPGATVSAERYELVRALSGRRSRDQILAMEWEGDPGPYVDLIPAYGPREDALQE
ncbi:MAG: maleylpyruvate isomerase family mycothiol-dependent enzyme [Actinobacteria bacterium]|nr:maleylpyruvate isomerase family mycothiol-dependent enzyme [Actinomycetota bacterium]